MKKNIAHIIQNLGKGGAETILVAEVNELQEYHNIVITLFKGNTFPHFNPGKLICLNVKHYLLTPFYFFKLKKILRTHQIVLVHSHLYWATLLARLATPATIPLVTTIHTYVAQSVEYKKKFMQWLEKWSYRQRPSIIMGDSVGVVNEYFRFFNLKPYLKVDAYSFVDPRVFSKRKERFRNAAAQEKFKIITVGRPTLQKNHTYLLDAFRMLKHDNFELHIYGMGDRYEALKQRIEQEELPVVLMGQAANIQDIIPQYDLFTMSSLYEGFSVAVLEAMALKMPMMLADIPSFREQGAEEVIYFDLSNPGDFVQKLKSLAEDGGKQQKMAEGVWKRVMDHFTLEHHMAALRKTYETALAETPQ
ncbi:MAG TPA: glycosyltransferase [Ferruginibacter sp.]|nr:glycosyltransferase [Bacteroidota bacterium]MCC6692292.1 glycosyltransferase [Chitinophagaceae bacterium]HMT95516.1 glycosyltransferase [Ferruginibacter sp.]MBS1926439.1 glycosyltransferase [Bacteroidota bacterium]HMU23464.1 glycosyltransferase [Ferruginibacter sp.]